LTDLKIAFPTDEHYPFQDELARSVALQIVRDFNPDEMITGSDGLDFYALSVFDHDPSRMKDGNAQAEINQWKAGQREWISAAPTAKRHYVQGNHEFRFERTLWKMPFLYELDVLKLSSVLGFASLNIPGEPECEVVYDGLVIRHGNYVRKGSAYTARAEIESEKHSISTMTGHTHRGGTHYVTTRAGFMQAYECFCLCDLTPPYSRGQRFDWQQGICLATISNVGLTVESILFHRKFGKVVARWRDKEYSSQ
jgi:hypothetical protein